MDERNKGLKIAMGVVCLVGVVSYLLDYVILDVPILGTHGVTLMRSLQGEFSPEVDLRTRVVQADGLNVRERPAIEAGVIGTIGNGTKVTVLEERDGWAKIPTSRGPGWVDTRYLESPDVPLASVSDFRALLKAEALDPRLKSAFQHLPPYATYLPAVCLGLLIATAVFSPFARGHGAILTLRFLAGSFAALSLYILLFHLLAVQAFKDALAQAAQSGIEQTSDLGLGAAFVGLFALIFTSNVRLALGPALYMLAGAGVVALALSLFLVSQSDSAAFEEEAFRSGAARHRASN